MKRIIQDENGKKMFMDVISLMPQLPEGWQDLGLASDLPEIVAEMEEVSNLQAGLSSLYQAMSSEVYTQMAAVFGTTNTDSASAHEKTWALMQSNPSAFANKGLKNHNGDVMITEQDVLDYANIKVQSVIDYGVWRLQRIQQFDDAKALLLGGN
jgi:hypothetical protein